MAPITIPTDCQRAWDALCGRLDPTMHTRRGGWYGNNDLYRVTGRPSTERKVRKLRKLGLLDWRKRPDNQTGGIFIEHRVATVPGQGREVDLETGRRSVFVPVAPGQDGVLFDMPAASRGI